MQQYDKRLWAIDETLYEVLFEIEEREVTDEEIQEFVERNLDDYIDYFKKEELSSTYALILEQSYSADQSELYALSTFPLFAVIEGLVATALKEYEIDTELKPKLIPHKKKLYYKFKNYVESSEDKLAINLLFFRRVFNIFKVLFKPSNNHPQHINRNWMMHGSYKYETVTKKDDLQLFQLIKAAEIIKEITFEKEEKAS